jgi:hypothetical protein
LLNSSKSAANSPVTAGEFPKLIGAGVGDEVGEGNGAAEGLGSGGEGEVAGTAVGKAVGSAVEGEGVETAVSTRAQLTNQPIKNTNIKIRLLLKSVILCFDVFFTV